MTTGKDMSDSKKLECGWCGRFVYELYWTDTLSICYCCNRESIRTVAEDDTVSIVSPVYGILTITPLETK
jgi:hypothetical protein